MNAFIKEAALSVGFDACGIAEATALLDDAAFLSVWLNEGKNAGMHYLSRNFDKRTDPRLLVPDAASVVVTLLNYFPPIQQLSTSFKIAKYAFSEVDYHYVIKEKLKQLEYIILEQFGKDCISEDFQHSFVDSAPVLERSWACRAGLGWIGKNKQLINPDFGSYCFIGVLIINKVLPYDKQMRDKCGTCTRCIDACPTGALSDGSLDARKCISYHTIESKEEIPSDIVSALNQHIFGCDICSDCCPWNIKRAKVNSHKSLSPSQALSKWTYENWLSLTEEDFRKIFRKSSINRAGFSKLKQNISLIQSSSSCH